MSGIIPSGVFRETSWGPETGVGYPAAIDSNFGSLIRLNPFAPRAKPTPDMTLSIDPGYTLSGTTRTEVGAWTQGTITASSLGITNVGRTNGILNGLFVEAWDFQAGVLVQELGNNSIVSSGITAGPLNGGSFTLAGPAPTNSTTVTLCIGQPIGHSGFQATTSNGSPNVTLSAGWHTTGMYANMTFNGPGVTNGTILSITDDTHLVLVGNAGAGAGAGTCTATVPIPAANPRIDLVSIDATSGLATWTIGTEAATPVAPALPGNGIPVAEIYTTTATTALTNQSNIIDVRIGGSGGGGGAFGALTAIASGATTDLGTITSHNAQITGTTTITSFGSSANTSAPIFQATFTGSLVLTHNASSLICPFGKNITTQAGTSITALYLGSGNWQIIDVQQAVNYVFDGSSGVTVKVNNAASGTHPLQEQDSAANGPYDVGYLDAPLSGGAAKSSNYTAILSDRGKTILLNGASITATIPANASVAYPVGTVLDFININSSSASIAITTDTLTLAGTTTTGPRTLARNGMCTARKVSATSWIIGGPGLT